MQTAVPEAEGDNNATQSKSVATNEYSSLGTSRCARDSGRHTGMPLRGAADKAQKSHFNNAGKRPGRLPEKTPDRQTGTRGVLRVPSEALLMRHAAAPAHERWLQARTSSSHLTPKHPGA